VPLNDLLQAAIPQNAFNQDPIRSKCGIKIPEASTNVVFIC
jgi:hypothetical protein